VSANRSVMSEWMGSRDSSDEIDRANKCGHIPWNFLSDHVMCVVTLRHVRTHFAPRISTTSPSSLSLSWKVINVVKLRESPTEKGKVRKPMFDRCEQAMNHSQ
jgi:hypothetical protein